MKIKKKNTKNERDKEKGHSYYKGNWGEKKKKQNEFMFGDFSLYECGEKELKKVKRE